LEEGLNVGATLKHGTGWLRIGVVVLALANLVGGLDAAQAAEFREGDVSFKVTCNFLKSAVFDPIVAPDQARAGHQHDFFGNKDINPGMNTFAELQAAGAGRTTCNDALDLSGYWAPSIYDADTGAQHRPQRMTGYYRRQQKDAAIAAYPDGLAVITGWKQGDTTGSPAVEWQCTGAPARTTPPKGACASGSYVQVSVAYPDCWDGFRTDSANHRDHMAFSVPAGPSGSYVCPETHPVAVPELTIYFNYPTLTHGNVTLSSGPWFTFHADYLNGWDRARLTERIDTCLMTLQKCASGA
jgi:hypothetical protein